MRCSGRVAIGHGAQREAATKRKPPVKLPMAIQAPAEAKMKKIVVVVVLFVMATCAIAQTAKAPQPAAPASSHAGRYQLFFSPHARADVYLLDTETGKIWKPITITNATDTNFKTAPQVWVYQERIDSERDFDNWSATHPSPAATTTQAQ